MTNKFNIEEWTPVACTVTGNVRGLGIIGRDPALDAALTVHTPVPGPKS